MSESFVSIALCLLMSFYTPILAFKQCENHLNQISYAEAMPPTSSANLFIRWYQVDAASTPLLRYVELVTCGHSRRS